MNRGIKRGVLFSLVSLAMVVGVKANTTFAANINYGVDRNGVYTNDASHKYMEGQDSYTNVLDKIKKSVATDTTNGYKQLTVFGGNGVSDHLTLKRWGEFLYQYNGKSVSSMPIGDIILKVDDLNVIIKDSREAKQWLIDYLIPLILDTIGDVGKGYDINVTNLVGLDNTLLADVPNGGSEVNNSVDNNKDEGSTEEGSTEGLSSFIEPIDIKSVVVHSIGENYGVQLNSKYVTMLNQLSIKDNAFFDYTLNADGIVCKELYGYLVTPKKVDNIKLVSDYYLVSNYVYSLKTGKVYSVESFDSIKFKEVGDLGKLGIASTNLMLKSTDDGLCLIPTLYEEWFIGPGGKEYPTGTSIDIKDYFISQASPVLSTGETVDFKSYIDSSGIIMSKYAEDGTLRLYNQVTPYKRFLKWLASDKYSEYITSSERKSILDKLKPKFEESGNGAYYKQVMKESGLQKPPYLLILLASLIVVGGTTYIVKRLKTRKSVEIKPVSAFDIDDEEEDED